ncbi:uncharacterized protein LOC121900611 [Thunnus maccoyii]|uniref:uncharacterized protein LOC121900611 n=1 Tax=Thunnus maccoyii TaxID=8240 RepID=UPI001C4B40C9|nr:uncharacterized protein LOC121900611 [Thunnus maccoyii]
MVERGGRLGELVQWTDLSAYLTILGNNLTLSTSQHHLHRSTRLWTATVKTRSPTTKGEAEHPLTLTELKSLRGCFHWWLQGQNVEKGEIEKRKKSVGRYLTEKIQDIVKKDKRKHSEAVKCWTGDGADIKQQSCDSDELCATVAYQGSLLGTFTQDTTRLCLPSFFISEGKHTYSFNVGFASMAASVHVCNTDRCNSQAIPYPDLKKNNLQCFTCYYPSSAVCDMTVQCVGMEDRCISGTVDDDEDGIFPTFGCVSANFCEVVSVMKLMPDPPFKFLSEAKCCGSSFCNSAWSVKLNVIPLLLGLITLIVC